MNSTSNIVLRNLKVGYGDHMVVRKVNLELEGGKIHCVFGRNGSGKTTLLKSISSLIPVLEGEVLCGGENIAQMTSSRRSKLISVVLTERPHASNLNVKDFIAYGRYPYTNWLGIRQLEDEEIVQRAMERTKLTEFATRALDSLSDGEMQKVQIARALAQNTDILMLDEIASHLDLVNKAEIFDLLKKSNEVDGKTILFTSHDIQFAQQLAHHFMVLKEGVAISYTREEFVDQKVVQEILDSDLLHFDPRDQSLRFNAT